jgi:C4-dicarboxylate-specific signal transduction histidine kinase
MANSEAPDDPRSTTRRAVLFELIDDQALPGMLAFREQFAHGRSDGGAALRSAQTALADASRMATLAEMSATIAHEVNQPLAAIVLGAEAGLRWLSHDAPDVAKVEQLLRRIVSNARRASDIVQRIRDMATRHEPDLVPLDLNDVVEEALLFVREELESRSVRLVVKLDAGLPVVLGDRIQLQQVIVNLIVNSAQAMAQSPCSLRRITLGTRIDGDGVAGFSIHDSGPGIPDENLDRVFESFFTTKEGGMGIGLAICRSIIVAHGGSIAVSNHPRGGAQFRFTIPATRPAARRPQRQASL